MNQLVYLYIENFNDFEPAFFNFSNDFHCHLIENNLFVHKRDNLFRDVLGKSVVDINVIAGGNGVGKTQLLKMMAGLACGSVTIDYFANYKYVLVHLSKEGDFILTSNMDVQFYPESLPGYTFSEKGDAISPIIYYSPFLDFNPLDVSTHVKRKPIIDISQSYFVMQDTEQSQKKMEIVPTVLTLKTNNIFRQIDFVTSKPLDINMPFVLPSEVSIRFNRLNTDKDDISQFDHDIFDKLTSYSADFFRDSKDNGISQEQMAKLMFLRNLLSLFFLAVNNNKSQSVLHHRFGDGLISEIDAYEGIDPDALIELYQRFFEADDIFMNPIFERLTNIAFSIIDTMGVEINFGSTNNHLTLSVSVGDSRLNELLTEMYLPKANDSNRYILKELAHFISFDWRNLSSGEKSFLDLFARLYLAKKQLKEQESTVLILLDEAEVGFHPEWQKRFISYLVDFINSVFTDFRVQMVLATHSPLVLSDFPSERVHLFMRTDEYVRREVGLGTFAQNIPELLANEFFIETTLIGDFAKRYIDFIIREINDIDKALGLVDSEKILKRINKIDEPVIKQLLLDTLIQRFDVGN